MNAPNDIDCGKTNAVLALYLDGDIGGGGVSGVSSPEDSGFELVCPDTLAVHLRDCTTCQVALQRARRLDAVLAENAGRVMAQVQDSGAIERLLAAAEQAAAEPVEVAGAIDGETIESGGLIDPGTESSGTESSPASDRPLQRAVFVPALLLVAAASGLVSLWLFQDQLFGDQHRDRSGAPDSVATTANDSRPAPANDVVAAESPPQVPAEALPKGPKGPQVPKVVAENPALRSGEILIADDAVRRMRTRAAQRPSLDRRGPYGSTTRQLEQLAVQLTDETLPAGERIAAATQLVQRSRPGTAGSGKALARLMQVLSANRCGPVALADALALAANEPHFTGYLRATLRRMERARAQLDHDDLAVITVASRIDSKDLDTAVRRVLRRHEDALEVTVAALRLPVRAHGGAALLLACWSDVTRRHSVDGGLMAQRLFAGQPRQMFTELNEELEAAHSVPRRVQCLLALASCTDRQSAAALLRWSTASCRKEAYAAAWSLSQLPHSWLTEAAARAAKDRAAFLLRAALACARLPAAKSWTDPMRLTPKERAVMETATFAVFPRLAEWFRDGPTRRSTIADD